MGLVGSDKQFGEGVGLWGRELDKYIHFAEFHNKSQDEIKYFFDFLWTT